jgi:WD40 repeat protein/serine/threonine protein kinase
MHDSPEREENIFELARTLESPAERHAFLISECGDSPELLRKVESLLAADACADDFFAESLGALKQNTSVSEAPGDRIGRYKLLQKIGEGGCGVVYLAQQETPVRRQVALKIIRLGMDSESVVARFEAERQALAMMDHPNIAQVFDGGVTQTGRPFFVMELVHGTKITAYCDEEHLSTRQRLELFAQICQAVQHAHQRGIIHRDLKPSNILVTGNDGGPVPKVIDFGIAKAIEGRLTDQTLFTAFSQLLGTPAYMSPEQALMTSVDIDTRSDIYSLGVLLYELLTGRTPFETQELLASGVSELCRTIREKEPLLPSTRIRNMTAAESATLASRRKSEPPRLIQFLRGDLDCIVGKCLEKERSARYRSAQELSEEVHRFLEGQPIRARPVSLAERGWRWCKRKPVIALLAASSLALLLAVAIGSPVAALRIERARKRTAENLVQQYVANGTRLMNQGDLFNSLLWFTEALKLDSGDPKREEPHRIRVASLLRQSPKLLNVFNQGGMLFHAEFSADGEHLVTASSDHTARLWEIATGRQLLSLTHPAEVYDATISQDGSKIATSCQDKIVRVWNARSGALVRELPHEDLVWRSCFSPDGQVVARAGNDHTASVWSIETGERTIPRLPHDQVIEQIAFSPDGRLLSTVSLGNSAYLWDVKTGEQRFKHAHNGNYAHVPFTPDGRNFLTCDGSAVRLWNTETFAEASFSPVLHDDGINSLGFGPDGRTFVSSSEDCTARVWDSATGHLLSTVRHATGINLVRASPDGRRIITGGENGVAQLWDTRSGQLLTTPLRHILYVKYLAFNPDGHRLLVNSCDQAARVWDTARIDSLRPPIPDLEREQRFFTRDRQRMLMTAESNTVSIVDLRTGARLQSFPHQQPVTYASFSGDDRMVITASSPDLVVSSMANDIFLWDVATGRRRNTLPMTQSFRLLYAAFSPDNSRVLTCGFDYLAQIWDTRSGQPIGDRMRHHGRVYWGAFSPDAKSVVTASWDKIARVWDATSGKPLTPPLQHRDRVTGAFWGANLQHLTTLTDGASQIWEIASGAPLTPPIKTLPPGVNQPESRNTSSEEALPRDLRPVADLVQLAQMLAVARIDSGGNIVPLRMNELAVAWENLHGKYPGQFKSDPREMFLWHKAEAVDAFKHQDSFAARFHLNRALREYPDDKICLAEQRALTATNRPGPDLGLGSRAEISARSSEATPAQVDLSRFYNLSLQQSLGQKPDQNNFASLLEGLHTLGGITFDVRGLIHLTGERMEAEGTHFPRSAEGIPVNRKCRSLHFLQATSWESAPNEQVGTYVLHYSDGEKAELPILFGKDTGDWWFRGVPASPSNPGDAVVAWTGYNPEAASSDAAICLYKATLSNPHPALEIQSIDFVSSVSRAAPFLAAITLE